MTAPSQQKLAQRWDSSVPQIREAIFSEPNDDFIEKLCKSEHLPEEKMDGIFTATTYVLLGFLHPEDLAEELKDAVGLNAQAATNVADAINKRIFTPLRDEIDKAFAPLSRFEGGPKIIQDIGPVLGTPPVSAAKPPPSAPPPVAPPLAAPPPPPAPKSPAAPVEKRPVAPMPSPGWSRETPSQPVVELKRTSTPPPQAAPKPTAPVPPPISKHSPHAGGAMDEFERLSKQHGETGDNNAPPPTSPSPSGKPMPEAPKAEAPQSGDAEPPPMMIHKDTEFSAQPQAPGFHLELPSKPINMQGGPPPTPPQKSAVLEFGGASAPKKAGPSTTRVVHYTDYKSASPERPTQPKTPPSPQGPRQVTEITSENPPSPEATPKPPAPNSPSPNPPATPEKVIHKDYSAEPSPKKEPLPPQPPPPPQSN